MVKTVGDTQVLLDAIRLALTKCEYRSGVPLLYAVTVEKDFNQGIRQMLITQKSGRPLLIRML